MTDINTETSKTPTETSTHTKRPGTAALWLLTLFAILAALTALYMNQQLAHNLEKQFTSLHATLDVLTQQQTNTEARLKAYRAVTMSREARSEKARLEFEKNLKETLQQHQNTSDDWRLLKARHLLELAGLNAHWSHDKDATAAMLSEADTILAPLHNPALISVRKALAHDIHQVKSTPTTDITGLLTQLNSAIQHTWSLPVNPLPEERAPTSTPPKTHKEAALNFLNRLVTIRHHTDTLLPESTLAFEGILRATIRLNLQEAEWAVLEQNNTVYQLALEQAIQTLEKSFISDKAQTRALIELLNQLKQTTLSDTQIIPESALTALNEIIANTKRHTSPGDAS
ncbi:MAG: uroporphyrinogen-III C-methyltransferase [Legionellaceae bacterium]|nr:uroporphyrinogen-III C-methyltransferase [Legionellaceae bacterium]